MFQKLDNTPKDHPKIPKEKIGLIIGNLGTPEATDYWAVRRYLKEFLSDRRVIDYSPWIWKPILSLILLRRPFSSGEAYKQVWNNKENESPLLTITRKQAKKLATLCKQELGNNIVVDFCMRYGKPSTEKVIRGMKDQGCNKILFFPLYPQYAAPTTATANDQVFRSLMKLNWQPAIRTVPPYFDDKDYIKALCDTIKSSFRDAKKKPEHLVLSYHGVPERYLLSGDPYHCQCQKTTRLIMEELGWTSVDLTTSFQSKFGPEKWIGPSTVELVADLAEKGVKNIAVIAPAFSSDCLETLEEINGEIRESFLNAGGQNFTYIPCLNDQASHLKALFKIAKTQLSGWI